MLRPCSFRMNQCGQRAEVHKYLPFAQKLPAYANLPVQRALVLGACSQEAEGRAGKASSPDSAIRVFAIRHETVLPETV